MIQIKKQNLKKTLNLKNSKYRKKKKKKKKKKFIELFKKKLKLRKL